MLKIFGTTMKFLGTMAPKIGQALQQIDFAIVGLLLALQTTALDHSLFGFLKCINLYIHHILSFSCSISPKSCKLTASNWINSAARGKTLAHQTAIRMCKFCLFNNILVSNSIYETSVSC